MIQHGGFEGNIMIMMINDRLCSHWILVAPRTHPRVNFLENAAESTPQIVGSVRSPFIPRNEHGPLSGSTTDPQTKEDLIETIHKWRKLEKYNGSTINKETRTRGSKQVGLQPRKLWRRAPVALDICLWFALEIQPAEKSGVPEVDP